MARLSITLAKTLRWVVSRVLRPLDPRAVSAGYARDVLDGSALIFGWLVTVRGIGGLLGAVEADRLAKLLSPARIVGLGLVATGLLYLLVANVPRVAVDVALVAVVSRQDARCFDATIQSVLPNGFDWRSGCTVSSCRPSSAWA